MLFLLIYTFISLTIRLSAWRNNECGDQNETKSKAKDKRSKNHVTLLTLYRWNLKLDSIN